MRDGILDYTEYSQEWQPVFFVCLTVGVTLETLSNLLERLTPKHRTALNWFIQKTNTKQSWTPAVDDVLLVTKAKGIYKPNWMEYALSVRQVLSGPYPDRNPIIRPDGTWIYPYYQEGDNPNKRDTYFTNRGLLACWRDHVPVGVMRQISGKPNVRYHVLGVALVAGWEDGYFFLEGFSSNGLSRGKGAQAQVDVIVKHLSEELQEADDIEPFEPSTITDARHRKVASIVERQGQKQFRSALLEAYSRRCAITDCDVPEALEASHIVPYLGPETSQITNGLLLRADIHILFDLGKIAVDSDSMTVLVSSDLVRTSYGHLAGKRINLPSRKIERPSKEALTYHRNWAGL